MSNDKYDFSDEVLEESCYLAEQAFRKLRITNIQIMYSDGITVGGEKGHATGQNLFQAILDLRNKIGSKI